MNSVYCKIVNVSATRLLAQKRVQWPVLLAGVILVLTGAVQGRSVALAEGVSALARHIYPVVPRQSDELDRIKALPSQDERIAQLEKLLIRLPRGAAVDGDAAREALMKEYALRGEQHLREGAPDKAARDFKSVMRVAPAEISDRTFDRFVFPMPIAMNTFGYRTESVDLMHSFEPRFASNPSRLIQIGFFYVQIEAPLEAVRILERAVKLAPNDHRAHNSLGTAYVINLRLDDAESEFKRAIELDPADEYANLNLGDISRARGDYEQAIAYYRAQIKIKSLDEEAHGGLAIALLATGRDEEAERQIAETSELGKTDYRFFTELAYFYATRKKYKLAREMVEKAATIEPRYAWVHITKANIDALEGKMGDALSTMILAQKLGAFPTLNFELAKQLMSVDGYDQAIEVMTHSFKITEGGEFQATLGGVLGMRSPKLDMLLDREREASLFLNLQLTTALQYRLAESLLLMNYYLNKAIAARSPQGAARGQVKPGAGGRKTTASRGTARQQQGQPGAGAGANAQSNPDDQGSEPESRPRRAETPISGALVLSAGKDAGLPGMAELFPIIKSFVTLDDGRQAYRMLWVARKLVEKDLALDAAIELARRAMAEADSATEPEGSMKDAPLLDRAGRKAIFLGRAEDAYGWALMKKGDTRGAIDHLTRSVAVYPPSGERKEALWHLAIATEEVGDDKRALDYYMAAYDPGSPIASVRHDQIAALYKKLNGTVDGLEEQLKTEQ
jgi:tetratricopeptide (TPR) repeat protein